MYTAWKKSMPVQACRLGEPSPLLDQLIREEKVVPAGPGEYQVFSVETDGLRGETAYDGDYVKVDAKGGVYPNKEDFFLQKHSRIGENTYMQKDQRLPAWDAQEPMCDEIAFLMEEKGLVIDRQSRYRYFSAPLWGTTLYAARDAVIIFYSITRDQMGRIIDADFNFVERGVFGKTYERIG
jgi:hypothetical protein